MADDQDWRFLGACNDYDPEAWFPAGTSRTLRADWRTPRDVCTGCDVLDECRRWALSTPDPTEGHGMWGALNPFERGEIRNARKEAS